MSGRSQMPSRSLSTRTAGPPSDAKAPDDKAVNDVYRSVQETGSLELAAKKLQKFASQQRGWEDDPEEMAYLAAKQKQDDEAFNEDEEGEEEEVMEVVHLQEALPGLWIGDLVAAMDVRGLEQRGITNVLSLLRPRLEFPSQFAVYALEIDDSADTDILTHLPSCVAWIQEALDKRQRSLETDVAMSPLPPRDKVIDSRAGETKPGGVLVHCQAGMSRSATVTAAYIMKALDTGPVEAVQLLQEKRPVVDPSDTFWYQLGLFYNADGRVSLKDRSTRQFYMERTTSQFMNGGGSAPQLDKVARFPVTPSESNPPTPMGGHGRRKIRCKMCRRHLAVREHMMDHILDQSPISRPRTPSNFSLPSPRQSISNGSFADRQRRASVVSDVINPLTGLPGRHTRHASISSAVPSPISPSHPTPPPGNGPEHSQSEPTPPTPGVPLPRKNTAPGLTLTASSPEAPNPARLIGDVLPGREAVASPAELPHSASADSIASSPAGPPSSGAGRPFRSAAELNASLPPHLLALRGGGGPTSVSALSSPFNASPNSSPEKETSPYNPHHVFPPSSQSTGMARSNSQSSASSGATVGRKMSLLAMTPADHPRQRRNSATQPDGGLATSGPPILVNPKCSGYFVEPLTWMEPFLKNGDISGKIVCPNDKCGVKIGNFDWAGVQCGCKEWVTPGFCISRSKVDEVW